MTRAAGPGLELLIGCRAIARFLRIGQKTLRDIEKEGAPINRDRFGVMRAEKFELWQWWKAYR